MPNPRPPGSFDWKEYGEKLREAAEGTFWTHLGCRLETVEYGTASICVEPGPELLNHHGILHGGVHASLLDQVMGIAAFTIRPGEKVVTVSLNAHFLKPPQTGTVRAEGEVLHSTRHTITAKGRVVDENGTLCAFGTASFRVVGPAAGGGSNP